ncbi:MAG: DUF1553 domain-containing protein [Acidimicrobiia bacterium]|nr:DUF1553 domain-containing protein [Acidimicrobiia bacterium]
MNLGNGDSLVLLPQTRRKSGICATVTWHKHLAYVATEDSGASWRGASHIARVEQSAPPWTIVLPTGLRVFQYPMHKSISAIGFLLCSLGFLVVATTPAAGSSSQQALPKLEAGTSSGSLLQRLIAEPAEVRLSNPGASQRLVVTGFYEDGTARDRSLECRYRSLSPRVAQVSEDGSVRGVSPGEAVVEAQLQGKSALVAVRVAANPSEVSVNFSQDLLSIFTQKSCNSPSCHGAIAGQNGFKLSLFGYDPEADFRMIVKAKEGRRVNLADPEQSLILLKPSASIPHGGGQVLPNDSHEYRTLLAWLKQGAKYNADGARVTGIEIFPKERFLVGVGETQRWAVVGRLSDGTTRDMSREVRYQSGDPAVATVTLEGVSKAVGLGLTHVLVRAHGKVAVARLGVIDGPPDKGLAGEPPSNFVDQAVFGQLRTLNLVPAGLSSDEEFLRRVYLDTIGLLPTLAERERFLQDTRRDKRSRLIDELLARSEFAAFWTTKLEDSFRNHQTPIQSRTQGAFRRYLSRFIGEDRPYDEVARELLTSLGDQTLNPAAAFWAPSSDIVLDIAKTNNVTTTVSRLFMGVRMECVECHNHPLENLTQNDFFDLSAFFGQIRLKHGYEAYRRVWYLDPERKTLHPQTQQPVKPAIPFDRTFPVRERGDYRIDLARWLASPENPFFARAIANRIWREYFNVGIVEPFDDFRTSNPPSNPALLDKLAQHLVANQFRLKALHRAILNSKTYQAASEPDPRNRLQRPNFFTHYNVRMLPAESLLDCLSQTTAVAQDFTYYPKGTRAQEVLFPDYPGYFLQLFGFPERLSLEERRKEPSLSQALHLMFGDTVLKKVQDEDNIVGKLIRQQKNDDQIIDHLFLSAYCREPAPEEEQSLKRYVATGYAESRGRKAIFDDLLWVVVNSEEFRTNH